MKKTWLNSNQ